MNDAEHFWVTEDRAEVLLHYAGCCFSSRKMRLFACACARQVRPFLTDPDALKVLDIAERMAEGPSSIEDLIWTNNYYRQPTDPDDHLVALVRASALVPHEKSDVAAATERVLHHLIGFQTAQFGRADTKAHVALIHEVFESPFRSFPFAQWRTSTAVVLAKQMYESHEFSAMLILADALQDAGCDSDEILNHCRDANAKHVRGCWVVDGVLGFS
jgi:hypothetical protein